MQSSSEDDRPFRVETLSASYNSLGMVLELLSRHEPFQGFTLNLIAKTVRDQILSGRNVAALAADNDIIAYGGWVHTLQASAELWVEDRGTLKVMDKNYDALALTTVVSTSPAVTSAMLREARRRYPQMRVYFKRTYDRQLKTPGKRSVSTRPAPSAE